MRTTLSIDEDILIAVRDIARREGRSMGEILSELARRALTASGDGESEAEFFGFSPLPHRGPPVTNELLDRLREDDLI